MFFKKQKEVFYYPGMEIPQTPMDRYRCLDAATLGVLQKAKKRLYFLMVVFGLCFCIIAGKLFFLTIVRYQVRPFQMSLAKASFSMIRQNVVDRNGSILATSLPTTDLSVNPRLVKNPVEVAEKLTKVFPDMSYEELYKLLTSSSAFKYIRRNMTPKERHDIMWLGYYFLVETKGEKRVYPQGRLFSHIIGMADIDNQGIAGLEKSYEKHLLSQNLETSLDLSVQETVHRTLEAALKKYDADGGVGIVMDVNTAEVLAMVSLPDYNPNLPHGQNDEKYFNKAVSGIYEFGSVFKLFNTAMALEYGDIKPTDKFDASETIKIGRKIIEDYRGQERPLSVPEILIHSSNIGSVKIAQLSGYKKQKEFLKNFEFYNKLPIVLPEKASPQYPLSEKWADITSANVAFGYGISVTPLHLIAGVSALVNGGRYHVPSFVRGGDKKAWEYQVISEKNSKIMRHMMWGVINWDSKSESPEQRYAVGGKTGSANLIVNGKYVQKSLRTTFVAAFPMNAPKYAVLVTLENPKGLKQDWGFNTAGWNAKPVGLEIISQIAPYLGVKSVDEWEQPAYMRRAIEESLANKRRS